MADNPTTVMALRSQLWHAGYRPVAVYGAKESVATPGKQPVGSAWQDRARSNPPQATLAVPTPNALNTGILCDGLRAVDIDVDDPSLAREVTTLARTVLGDSPIRYREGSGRCLLLYRASEGEPKKEAVSAKLGKVEVLGRGQQFVAFGDHTQGGSYYWQPDNFTAFHRDQLNAVSEDQVRAFLKEVSIRLGASRVVQTGEANVATITEVSSRQRTYAAKVLADHCAALSAKCEGSNRNDALNALAYHMGRMIGAGWIELAEVEGALTEACRQNGYLAKDGANAVRATMRSGIESGGRSPMHDFETIPVLENVRTFVARHDPTKVVLDAKSANPLERGAIVRRVSDVIATRIEWLWPDRIAVGKLTLIAGDPGLGKSQLTAFLAAGVTTGSAWPNNEGSTTRGSVVMLSCEDDIADTIRPRLEAAGADIARVHVVEAVRDNAGALRGLSLLRDLALLEEVLEQLPDTRLVVIDPITAYLDKIDSHRTSDVRSVLAPVQELANRRRVAVVAVSHLNKSGGNGKSINAVTGSGAFVAASRATFLVAKSPDDPELRLFIEIKNNLASAAALSFRIRSATLAGAIQAPFVAFEAGTVIVSADEAISACTQVQDRTALHAAQQFLTEELRNGPALSKELFRRAKEQRISEKTIRRAKDAMGIDVRKEGFQGEWVWSFPFDLPNPAKAATTVKDANVTSMTIFDHLGPPLPTPDSGSMQ